MGMIMREIKDLEIYEVSLFDSGSQGMNIKWQANIGFGEVDIYQKPYGNWTAYTESMCKGEDKEFIRKLLNKWVDEIEVIG